ncbi:MAG: hypothetical protein AB1500_03670 [Bacillota bacterium]
MALKDRVALGTVSGIAATVPPLILNWGFVKLGLVEYYSFQLSAGVFITKIMTETPSGMFLGGVVWESAAAFFGILIVYFINFTGKDYWWLKGIIIPIALIYILVFGFLFHIGAGHLHSHHLGTNFSLILENVLFGIITAFLAIHWGKGILYTEGSRQKH